MPSEKALARKADYEAAKAERLANPKPKVERSWMQITEVPEHVQAEEAKLAIRYLLTKTDKVEMMQFPKDQSQYRAYLDDGAYKGCFVFTWTENGLTPLKVYEKLQQTGWPGYSMGWVKDAARQEMLRELTK
jgi:hypothetical protein